MDVSSRREYKIQHDRADWVALSGWGGLWGQQAGMSVWYVRGEHIDLCWCEFGGRGGPIWVLFWIKSIKK